MTMTAGLPVAFRDGHHEMPPITRNGPTSGLPVAFRDGHHKMLPATRKWDYSGLPVAFHDGHHEMQPVTRKSLSSHVLNHEDHCHHKTGNCCHEANVGATPFPTLTKINGTNASRILEQHPQAFVADSEVFALLVDSGASCSVTHKISDFITELRRFNSPEVLGGLASGIAIEGVGEVKWTMKTDDWKFRTL